MEAIVLGSLNRVRTHSAQAWREELQDLKLELTESDASIDGDGIRITCCHVYFGWLMHFVDDLCGCK